MPTLPQTSRAATRLMTVSHRRFFQFLTIGLTAFASFGQAQAAPPSAPAVVNVWPGLAPGETTSAPGTSGLASSNYGPISYLFTITQPHLSIYQPPNADGTKRPCVIVLPGGAYNVCTTDIEGAEIAEWLNAQGYVAAVLYYRANWQPNRTGAFQDAQRGIALLRANAASYGIDPTKIGLMGFSAGGHLAARTAAANGTLAYGPIDSVDTFSARPDFTALVYPAYLIDQSHGNALDPVVAPVAGEAPLFLSESKDDPFYPNVPVYAGILDIASAPETNFVYNAAGHGYGVRVPATSDGFDWVNQAKAWLRIAAPTPLPGDVAVAQYTATAPVIDGAADSAWDNAVSYPIAKLVGSIPAGDTQGATWKSMWDNNYLYLLVSVTDNAHVAGTPVTNGDAVEVYIDANDSKATAYANSQCEYVFGLNNPTPYAFVTGAASANTNGIVFAQSSAAAGYTEEIAIPWTTMGVGPSRLVGLDIGVSYSDSASAGVQGKLFWNSATDSDSVHPAGFGSLLALPGPGMPVPGAPVSLSALAGVNQVVLTWTGTTPATGYNVYRGSAPGSETGPIASVVGNTFVDTAAVSGSAYYYVVTATNSAGESARSNEAAAGPQTAPSPAIASFTPATGAAGTQVTVKGTNLAGVTSVKFHGVASTALSGSTPASITATVPAGATSGAISLTTAGGTAVSAATFTVPPAAVTTFAPASGPSGAQVVIGGNNFTGAGGVKFNGTAATTFKVVSDSLITATVPAGASTGPVSVTAQAGAVSSAASFTVTSAAPAVSGFSPATGPVGTVVTISGTNLNAVTSVRFNGVASTAVPVSPTSLTATVPTGAATGPISVTNPGGTFNTPNAFVVVPLPPTITSFTPTSGAVGAGTTITGTNLLGVTSVKFNGVASQFLSRITSTTVSALIPAGATTGPITLTTPGGTVSSATDFVLTIPNPGVTAYSPVTGPVGTSVLIAGQSFTGATSVTFNGIPAAFTVLAPAFLQATVPAGATSGPVVVTTPGGKASGRGNFTVTH